MPFHFNGYSTPLLFGFAQGWLYALLFWRRGRRQGRLSDLVFGCLLAALTFEVWEYMLGFAGIEVLWRELEFFPRTFGLLVPPLAFFYLKSQFDTGFRFSKKDLWHGLPFAVYAVYHLAVFSAGPAFVSYWKGRVHDPLHIELVELLAKTASQVVYAYWSWRLYKDYHRWAPSQFSDPEAVSFGWFRNFLIAFVAASLTGWGMTAADLWLGLDFWHDWWDELFTAALICYLAIEGFAQRQPRALLFSQKEDGGAAANGTAAAPPRAERLPEADLLRWKEKLEKLMAEEHPYLDPELALPALAARLGTNASVLSAVVNGPIGASFNDYVNGHRVEAVKRMLADPACAHYSLLGVGLACGFNSKSTFNRVFRKMTGAAPGDFLGKGAS